MSDRKYGKNKERCKRYLSEGRREINKERRKERNEKRAAKFAERKEEGKSYVYKKGYAQDKIDGKCPGRENYNPVLGIWMSNVGSGQGRHGEFCRWRKMYDKLDYALEQERLAQRAAERKDFRKHARKNEAVDQDFE